MRVTRALVTTGVVGCLVALSACTTQDTIETSPNTLTIAAVDNGDIDRLRELSEVFIDANPGVTIEWVQEEENRLRQTISSDVATGGGRFDIVTVGTYETPMWAEQEWLLPLDGMPAGFDADLFIPSLREALSYEERLHAAPFYGESSFTMFRTDVFADAGLEMPERPSWDFILDAAATISESSDVNGVCVRGKAGWGENMAVITAMANSYGARWFDEQWDPQLDTDEWRAAIADYLTLAEFAPAGVASNGYLENLALFQEGKCAIWVDATSSASFITDPDQSSVAGDVGFAYAPGTGVGVESNWLWAWSLAIPKGSENQDLAKEFITWATSDEYLELAAAEYGWVNVPPGAQLALYENADYLEAAPFADLVLESMENADPEHPTVQPVPYRGIQYVGIPAFQSIGTAVGNQMAGAVSGEISLDDALKNSQWVTGRVIEQTRVLAEGESTN